MQVSTELDKEHIYEFLMNNLNERVSIEGFAYEPIKLGGIYWSLTAISLLKGRVNDIVHPRFGKTVESIIIDVIKSAKNSDGGFGNAQGHPSSIIATHYAILTLSLLNKLCILDHEATSKFIAGLQNEDGSFSSDEFGEADSRHSYSAIVCLSLLGGIELINIESSIRFILSCRNFDGGFGWYPKGESHAAATFCCVGALAELGVLDVINLDRLGYWLSERQTAGGGCNGRAEKSPDICYSWWVLSALDNIGRLSWIDSQKLAEFILKSQNPQDGGIGHFPGFMGDVFHTFFALAALSLIDYESFGLFRIHPLYATTKFAIDSLNNLNKHKFIRF